MTENTNVGRNMKIKIRLPNYFDPIVKYNWTGASTKITNIVIANC